MQPAWKKIHLPPPHFPSKLPLKIDIMHSMITMGHRNLIPNEQKMSTIDRELKVIELAAKKIKYVTNRMPVNAFTDHRPWTQVLKHDENNGTADTSPKESKYASSLYKRIQKSICWHAISTKPSILQPPSERICHHDRWRNDKSKRCRRDRSDRRR